MSVIQADTRLFQIIRTDKYTDNTDVIIIKVELLSSSNNYPREISRDFYSFCFLYEAPFSTSRSILFFTNNKTTNYPAFI